MTFLMLANVLATTLATGHLDEVSNSQICDTVQQYSGYYRLTTGPGKNYL